MRLKARAAVIKRAGFQDLIGLIAGTTYEGKVRCPLPDHHDRTPSCFFYHDRWHCFGCSRGGDAVEFAIHYLGIPFRRAVEHLEGLLGLNHEGDDAKLVRVRALVKATKAESDDRFDWLASIDRIEARYLDRVRPYLRHPDSVISEPAYGVSEYVWRVLDEARSNPPTTSRLARESARHLSGFADEHAKGIARDVQTSTGKDRLDCALQGFAGPQNLVCRG